VRGHFQWLSRCRHFLLDGVVVRTERRRLHALRPLCTFLLPRIAAACHVLWVCVVAKQTGHLGVCTAQPCPTRTPKTSHGRRRRWW
jgi:hypothetical protein